MYTQSGGQSSIMVALQVRQEQISDPPMFYTSTFENALLVRSSDEGCINKTLESKRLTVPHSVALVDFDGDCMADLFTTVQDLSTGKKYYEIYLRREFSESVIVRRTSTKTTDLGGQTTT